MIDALQLEEGSIIYEVVGAGPLVVLAHGMGDSRHAYRFLAPLLEEAGYRVASVDIRGCGDSTAHWSAYSRTDIAGDIVELVSHLGGPALIVGHSISGGAATIAAANAPGLIAGVVELAPFTRGQSLDIRGLIRDRRHRAAMFHLGRMLFGGSVGAWTAYLDLAVTARPCDWVQERARIMSMVRRPERMSALRKMARTVPTDAGAKLREVQCPVLIIQGAADPDWTDPAAEGRDIVRELSPGIGQLAIIPTAGHYPHVEAPDEVFGFILPFVKEVLRTDAGHGG